MKVVQLPSAFQIYSRDSTVNLSTESDELSSNAFKSILEILLQNWAMKSRKLSGLSFKSILEIPNNKP